MRIILAALACAGYLFAQSGSPVNQTAGGPPTGYQRLLYYTGSNLDYVCIAKSSVKESSITVSGATTANPVVFTATAHGLGDYANLGAMTVVVKIRGGIGNWAAVNGTFVATTTSADAFSIAVNSTGFGSFSGQSLTVTTVAPRTNQNVWAISKNLYDGSNNLIFNGWAALAPGAGNHDLTGGNTSEDKVCANRATYGYQ